MAHWIFDASLTTENGVSTAQECPASYICSRTSADANMTAATDAGTLQCYPTNLSNFLASS